MKKIYFLLGLVLLMFASCTSSTKVKVTNESRYYAIMYVDNVEKKQLNAGKTSSITVKDASKTHHIYVTLHEYSSDTRYYIEPTKSIEAHESFKWTKDYEIVINNTSMTIRESDKKN